MHGLHHLWPLALIPLGTIASCRVTAPAAPVPVQGTEQEVRALSGQWVGRYSSKATGRRGTIRFNLPERADTGFGEVEITFSPALHLLKDLQETSAKDEPQRTPCTVVDIRVVRVEGGRVRGTMAPYWDPDCDCQARTVFEGKIAGRRITGTFSTERASTDRRILTGKWEATREGGKS
jgi:hypothetical protein